MRKFLNLAVLFVLVATLFSCRKNEAVPEDTHEHEEISRIILKLTKTSDQSVQTVIYTDGNASGDLALSKGETYTAELSFLAKHDNHYHEVNSEIIEEKDEHFITFSFAGVDMGLLREAKDDVRSDGNIVGLKSTWTVETAPNTGARVDIKLHHKPTSITQNSPSQAKQFGTTVGGSTDVDVKIAIK